MVWTIPETMALFTGRRGPLISCRTDGDLARTQLATAIAPSTVTVQRINLATMVSRRAICDSPRSAI